jgi:uncharacterized protein YecA (UPF0149 family)
MLFAKLIFPFNRSLQLVFRRTKQCQGKSIQRNNIPFETTSKRRKGYPSETRVKRGLRIVHNDKELVEKLGRNDLCPCNSNRKFQKLLSAKRKI